VVEDGELGGELTVFGTKLINGMVRIYTRDQRTRIELGYEPVDAAFELPMFTDFLCLCSRVRLRRLSLC